MLFSMLFGAGNLIFPAFLGQAAGENVWQAVSGFIISDAGLALVSFIAIAKSGSFEKLIQRVHPLFAIVFPVAIYLSIGPGLAIPRAGSLAYEMGVKPFLPASLSGSPIGLFTYTILFFFIVFWFAKTPTKLVDRLGKMLTPALLFLIFIVFIKSLFKDFPPLNAAVPPYSRNPFTTGILDGYQTMDGLCALIYGVIFINLFKEKKIESRSLQVKYLIVFGLISGLLLSICYLIIAYLGAATPLPGTVDNGAVVLSSVMKQLFGNGGAIVLGLIFTLACLNVCIGLITSCAQFFSNLFPKVSYIGWSIILCIASGVVANLGLTQILKVSVPILRLLYPLAITLMIFGLIHDRIPYHHRPVYGMTISFVGLFSLLDVINSTLLNGAISGVLSVVPLQNLSFGWAIPGLIGFILGSIIEKQTYRANKTNREAA